MDFGFSNRAHGAHVSARSYDYGLRKYMLNVYNYMATALVVTGLVAFISSKSVGFVYFVSNPLVYMVLLFSTVGVTFNLHKNLMTMSVQRAQIMLFLVAALIGVTFSGIFLVFTGLSIARTFFITSSMFGALSIYGYTTKKNLSAIGTFCIMGAFGLLFTILLNMFMKSAALHFAISVVGVIVFSGITAYDTQIVKDRYYQLRGAGDNDDVASKVAVIGALNLYTDFINIFIHLLSFFGERDR